jgi:antibiotic biosynthesis monooxygenase (ABM) superfamily enzyme
MDDTNAAALITKIQIRPGSEKAFAYWHSSMSTAPSDFPGFISTEIKPPLAEGDTRWSVVQHFRSPQEMAAWRQSASHQRLLSEAGAIADVDGTGRLHELESIELQSDSTVTEVITTFVKPGFENAYREWAGRIHAAEAQFPGYRGSLLQPSTSEKQPYWTTLVHFAKPAQLEAWLDSAERKKLLGEHVALVESWTAHRLPKSFAGWFPAEGPDREPTTTLKQSMVVLLVLFPIVMAELRFLSRQLAGVPPSIATFVGNAISVGLIAWPFMPIAIFFLSWWLTPKKGAGGSIRAAGFALVLALYVVEVAALWNLL